MAKKRATLTDLLNDLTFQTNFDRYKLIAVNTFEWDGLPAGIEERHIEALLFDHGKALFVLDPVLGFLCLEAQEGTGRNVYNDPITWRAIGLGYNVEYPVCECVVVENNKMRLPTAPFVLFYVNKITEAERTMDVNVKANKTPYIVVCDEKNKLTFEQIFQKIDGNVPAIYVDKAVNTSDFQIHVTGVPLLVGDLTDYKHSVESDLLTFLGKNNVNVDKKERLITDEAQSNDELIGSFLELQLEARQRACDAINAMFGHLLKKPVTVRVRFPQHVENSVENQGEGDGENVEDV